MVGRGPFFEGWDVSNMFESTSKVTRRTIVKAGSLTLVGLAALRGEQVQAAEEMNAAEKANLAVVTAYLRGYNDQVIDADKMASVFSEDCAFRTSETAPTQHGKAALIASIKRGAENPGRWDIQVVNAFSRGPIVAVSRAETNRTPGRPERHIAVVGLFVFKDGKISEWYDYLPKAE